MTNEAWTNASSPGGSYNSGQVNSGNAHFYKIDYYWNTGSMEDGKRITTHSELTRSEVIVEYDAQGGGGTPRWASDVNTDINAFGVANSAKTELIDYAVRSNYKSARTWSKFNNLRSSQQAWRTTNTLGKTGANYLKYAKGLGYVGAGLTTTYSAANAGMYYYNGGTDWQVGTKASLDVIMTGVGFLGPIGFGISATYFILDATTGGFGGFGAVKP